MRKMEFKRPMVWLAFVFVSGTLVGLEAASGRDWYALIAIVFLIASGTLYYLFKIEFHKIAISCAIGFFAAYIGAASVDPKAGPNDIMNFAGDGKITLTGKCYDLPRVYPDKISFYIDVESVYGNQAWKPANGKIRVTAINVFSIPSYGDKIILTTNLKRVKNFRNPGSFDYERHMAIDGIFVTGFIDDEKSIRIVPQNDDSIVGKIQNYRRIISSRIDRLSEGRPEGQVLRALVVGDRYAVPDDVNLAFSKAGVAHLLSVSGLHLSIVALIFYYSILWLLKRSEKLMLAVEVKKLAAFFTIAPVFLYSEFTGGSVPTVRSAIMATVYLLSIVFGKRNDFGSSIALAAIIVAGLWPPAVTSVGALLSFGAVIVIAATIPVFQYRFPLDYETDENIYWIKFKRNMKITFFTGTAISIAIAPIIATTFNSVQFMGPISNLILIPLIGWVALLLGIAATFIFPIYAPLADFIFYVDFKILSFAIDLIKWFAAAPGNDVQPPMPTAFQAAAIFVVAISAFALFGPPGKTKNAAKLTGALFAALLIASIAFNRFSKPNATLEITYLDLANGDSSVLVCPDGKTIVIDTGNKFGDIDSGERIIAPYLRTIGKRAIDAIVVSHPHNDHIGGLEWLLENYKVKEIWIADAAYPAKYTLALFNSAKAAGVPIRKIDNSTGAFIFGGVEFAALWPPKNFPVASDDDVNTASLVLKVGYADWHFIFAGDAESPVQDEILATGKDVESSVLLAPHHGGKNSISQNFFRNSLPKVLVVSARSTSRLTYPHKNTVAMANIFHANIFNIDDYGAIRARAERGRLELSDWTDRKWVTLKKYERSR